MEAQQDSYTHIDLVVQEALHYMEIGRYGPAREKFAMVLEHEPTHRQALYCIAMCCYVLDDLGSAEEWCEEALRVNAADPDVHTLVGRIHFQSKQYVQAESSYLTSLSLHPQNAATIAEYAFLMLQTGHVDKAHKLLEEAIQIDPMDIMVTHVKFNFVLVDRDKQGQEATLRQLFESGIGGPSTLTKMGEAAISRNNFREAREHYRQAFLMDPQNHKLLKRLREIDRLCHPLFYANRIVAKLGGTTMFTLISCIYLFIFSSAIDWASSHLQPGFLDDLVSGVAAVCLLMFFIFVISTWVSWPLYRIYQLIAYRR